MSTACYVYGIAPAGVELNGQAGPGIGGQVSLVVSGGVAAIVDSVDPDRELGTRADLVAHSQVLDGLAARGPVLPLRFGSVLTSEEAVAEELLAGHEEHFSQLLAGLAGRCQMVLRARYELDTVLAEIVRARPDIAELRERTARVPEDAGMADRVRLGELVAEAVASAREADAHHVLDVLAPHAEAHQVRSSSAMDDLVDVSFLVHNEDRDEFEAAAEQLAERLAGRARLRLLGPMAAYEFVPEG